MPNSRGFEMLLDDIGQKINDSEVIHLMDKDNPLHCNDLSRRDVRSLVFHLLYTAEAFNYEEPLEKIVEGYDSGFYIQIPCDSEVFKTVQTIINKRDFFDEQYRTLLTNWRFERIGVSTKLILRYAIWELCFAKTDPCIVMNEAVELAKCFAEHDAYRFVNGILDKFVHEKSMTTEPGTYTTMQELSF